MNNHLFFPAPPPLLAQPSPRLVGRLATAATNKSLQATSKPRWKPSCPRSVTSSVSGDHVIDPSAVTQKLQETMKASRRILRETGSCQMEGHTTLQCHLAVPTTTNRPSISSLSRFAFYAGILLPLPGHAPANRLSWPTTSFPHPKKRTYSNHHLPQQQIPRILAEVRRKYPLGTEDSRMDAIIQRISASLSSAYMHAYPPTYMLSAD